MASTDHSPENDPFESSQGQISRNVVEMNDLKTSAEETVDSHMPTHPETAVATSSSLGMLQPAPPAEGAEATQNSTIEAASSTGTQEDALSTGPPAPVLRTAPELSRLDSVAIGPSTDTPTRPFYRSCE